MSLFMRSSQVQDRIRIPLEDVVPPGDLPPDDLPPGAVHPGDVHPGDVHPGDVHPGDVHPGDVHPGDAVEPDPGGAPADVSVPDGTGEPDAPGAGADGPPPDALVAGPSRGPGWVRRVLVWATNILAALAVFVAFVTPDRLDRVTPEQFARIPVEALLGGALVLLLPTRLGRALVALGAIGLSVLDIGKVLDTGFYLALSRPFDPVIDWIFLGDGVDFLSTSLGHTAAVGAVVATALLTVAGIATIMLSALRMASLAVRHRAAASVVIGTLALVWVTGTTFGVHLFPHKPLADKGTAAMAYDRLVQVRTSLRDERAFAREASVDAYKNVPADQLLGALRGKNVSLTFVESYGRSALEDPRMAPKIVPILDAGTKRLQAAGFSSLSGWLTSPTYGGGSWLAHSTLQSGLWIDNQERYQNLVTSQRITLTSEFHAAGWRTVAVEPAIKRPWPEGNFYKFDKVYNRQALGYNGPKFGYSPMTDQYVFSTFQKDELDHVTKPVMTEIVLTSSHIPWAPLPEEVPWESVGDGSIFDAIKERGHSRAEVWKNATLVREAYTQSVQYTMSTLISYLQKYGDENTVMVFLGDHQPSPVVTGLKYGSDVPVTIVAKDPAVLKRIAGWGWTPGIRPDPKAPVWRMSDFRNKFLEAFSTPGASPGASQPSPAASASVSRASAPAPAAAGSAATSAARVRSALVPAPSGR